MEQSTGGVPPRPLPAPPRPERPRWHHRRGVRLVMLLGTVSLLVGLVAGVLSVAGLRAPGTEDDLLRDLRAGTAAEVQASPGPDGTTRVGWDRDGTAYAVSLPATAGPPGDVALALERRAAAAGRPVTVDVVPATSGEDGPGRVVVVLLLVGSAAALLTLLVALTSPRPGLTSRWGWLWLLGTPLGPPLYWLLEPSPLWRTRDAAAPDRPYRRLGGGVAYLASTGLEVLFAAGVVVVLALSLSR